MSPTREPSRTKPVTYLMHARPRLMFHLGHVKMLNVLYRILLDGHSVVLLLIPYDEHERRNRTIRTRLEEEIELTKGFYRNYLGFAKPRLKIVSTPELDLPQSRLREIQSRYSRLYDQGSPGVKKLIEQQNRAWASPNILFVPKCLAAIEQVAPDHLICGKKHQLIAQCFDEVLRDMGHVIPFTSFDDFPDLFMESGMDRMDSVHSYIDVNDNDDFVLHKLSLLRDMPGQKSAWLQAFQSEILDGAPERVKNGISRVHRSEAEKEIALTKLLANVRALIPYALDDGESDVQIVWGGNLAATFTEPVRQQMERIARKLFQGNDSTYVSLHRVFRAGKSGATVLEVREHESPGEFRVSNVSVLKIGPEHELKAEKDNFDRFVKPRGTAAFMTIKRGGVAADGLAGILYQDAQHHLGMRLQDTIGNISSLFQPVHYDYDEVHARLSRLLSSHLHEVLYKHGRPVDAGSIRRYANEFLPAEYRVQVTHYSDGDSTIHYRSGGASDRHLRAEVRIAEVDLRRRILRAYTIPEHHKVDVELAGDDEVLLNEVMPGRTLHLDGRLLAVRDDFYDALLARLNVAREGSRMAIDRQVLADPVRRIEEFLEREHHSFTVSPIHGDLHAGNVLFGGEGFGIIDYCKMRERFPALYDVAYLFADLKSRFVANRFGLPALVRLEEAIVHGRGRFGRDRRSILEISLFEYDSLPAEIKLLGSSELFYSLLGIILLGRLKFDLPEVEKRVGLALAHYAFERVR
ncbi:phosphotransferase [Sphaerisporangium aureirubrum]|uniref:Phosphotransferase n=1 Tax=Sphaerisporangium aureirubrum TaxID=1544736 RepID=A0ABW1NJ70_9ACTN